MIQLHDFRTKRNERKWRHARSLANTRVPYYSLTASRTRVIAISLSCDIPSFADCFSQFLSNRREHTCFLCAKVQIMGPIELYAFSSRSHEQRAATAAGVFAQNSSHALYRFVLFLFFSLPLVFFCFLDAVASQRHAPPTLWSSDRRVVVDEYNTIISHFSWSKTFGSVKTRASGARVASTRRQGRIKADDSNRACL